MLLILNIKNVHMRFFFTVDNRSVFSMIDYHHLLIKEPPMVKKMPQYWTHCRIHTKTVHRIYITKTIRQKASTSDSITMWNIQHGKQCSMFITISKNSAPVIDLQKIVLALLVNEFEFTLTNSIPVFFHYRSWSTCF